MLGVNTFVRWTVFLLRVELTYVQNESKIRFWGFQWNECSILESASFGEVIISISLFIVLLCHILVEKLSYVHPRTIVCPQQQSYVHRNYRMSTKTQSYVHKTIVCPSKLYKRTIVCPRDNFEKLITWMLCKTYGCFFRCLKANSFVFHIAKYHFTSKSPLLIKKFFSFFSTVDIR